MFVDRSTQSCQHSASCRSLQHTFVSSTGAVTVSTYSVVTAASSPSVMVHTACLKLTKSSSASIQFLTYRCVPAVDSHGDVLPDLWQATRLILFIFLFLRP